MKKVWSEMEVDYPEEFNEFCSCLISSLGKCKRPSSL